YALIDLQSDDFTAGGGLKSNRSAAGAGAEIERPAAFELDLAFKEAQQPALLLVFVRNPRLPQPALYRQLLKRQVIGCRVDRQRAQYEFGDPGQQASHIVQNGQTESFMGSGFTGQSSSALVII